MANPRIKGFGHRRLRKPRQVRWVGRGQKTFELVTGRVTWLLTYKPWKGICATDVKANKPGVLLAALPSNYWRFPDMKKRSTGAGSEGGKHLAPMETEYFGSMLSLVEHCALRQYDDGSPRETGWITIKTQGAAWCVQVKDADTCTTFTAVAGTLDKALETAHLLLSCDDAPWEPDTWLLSKRKGKPK